MKKKDSDRELDFVLSHYRANAFNPDEALRKMSPPARRMPLRRLVGVAASLLCIVAIAGVVTWKLASAPQSPEAERPAVNNASAILPSHNENKPSGFHFNDTPLPQVLEELGQYYNVHLEASDTSRHLTGDFAAGNLNETLLMIEEVLDVKITLD
ncbi:MAG: DUF4974 domain-containing protein [Prevotella sp.]|nr:DUF4974 domain-containing protein [Prevotella sp.]